MTARSERFDVYSQVAAYVIVFAALVGMFVVGWRAQVSEDRAEELLRVRENTLVRLSEACVQNPADGSAVCGAGAFGEWPVATTTTAVAP